MDQPKAQTPEQRKAAPLLASCVIFLVALNLRPAIVAVGPLLSSIGTTFGWGESIQGLLGSLPLLAFALFSLIVGALTAKLDSNKVLFWALIALAGGCIVRSLSGESMVWLGTLVIGASIAVGNVLAPAIVKRDFIDNISFATGAYSACVTAGSALAGLTASAAADALGGWQPALAFWAIPALLAALLWLLRTKLTRNIKSIQTDEKSSVAETHLEQMPESAKEACPISENAQAKSPLRTLLKRPSTWLVTLFMGLQSAAFYTFCNWLPGIAGAAGFSSGEAGVHLFIFQALGIVSGLLIPRFMYLRDNQVCAGILASAPLLVAALGWLLIPRLSLLWSVFGGDGARGFARGGAYPYLPARKNPRRNSCPFGFCSIAWLPSCRMRTLCIRRTHGNNAGIRSALGIYGNPRHGSMRAVAFRGSDPQRSVVFTHCVCRETPNMPNCARPTRFI